MTFPEACTLFAAGRVICNRHPENPKIVGYLWYNRQRGETNTELVFDDGWDEGDPDAYRNLSLYPSQIRSRADGWELADPATEARIINNCEEIAEAQEDLP